MSAVLSTIGGGLVAAFNTIWWILRFVARVYLWLVLFALKVTIMIVTVGLIRYTLL